MRKVILYIACSLDLFIARTNGDVSWLFQEGDYGYKKFYSTIGTILLGRKTWEKALHFEEKPYQDKRCIVFTRRKTKPSKKYPYAEFVSGDIVSFVQKLKKQKGKNIWLGGGGELASYLLNAGIVDELRLYLHPIILGKGIPLFYSINSEIKLTHEKTHAFSDGLVEMIYSVQK